ncbi:hypothetical protein K502DRAFT_364672 [Neoconidiobolus thromboides FSU 785]|nr:hypothetical protein K502DRAFT_364672 [Neoconidiobolus thromboides FSU 785]
MNPVSFHTDEDNFEAFVNQDMFLDSFENNSIPSPNTFSSQLNMNSVNDFSTNFGNQASHSPELNHNSTSPSSWISNSLTTPTLLPTSALTLEEWNSVCQLGLVDSFPVNNGLVPELSSKINPINKMDPILENSMMMPMFQQIYCAKDFSTNQQSHGSNDSPSSQNNSEPLSSKSTSKNTRKAESGKSKQKKKTKSDFHPIRNAYATLNKMPVIIAPKPGPVESKIYVPVPQPKNGMVKLEPQEATLESPYVPVKQPEDNARQMALTKRQERLIKNRAAALNSRKRKREQVIQLENENNRLNVENAHLKSRIEELELMVLSLGGNPTHTNLPSLQSIQVHQQEDMHAGSETGTHAMEIFESEKGSSQKSVNVIFMLFFFSFVLFSYPTVSNHYNSSITLPSNEPILTERVISELATKAQVKPSYSVRHPDGTPQYHYPELSTRASDMVISHVFSVQQQLKKETNTQELFSYVNRNYQNKKKEEICQAPVEANNMEQEQKPNKITDLIPFAQESKIAYLYASTIRSFIPRQGNNSEDLSSKDMLCEKPTMFSVLTPWREDSGSYSTDERYLRIDMQVIGSPQIVNGKDLLRH